MGKEKKPSIYVDRGTLGSADELDEYGVWVKNEPYDLDSTGVNNGNLNDPDDMDFEIPAIDALPDFDSLDDEPQQASNDDFDLPLMDFDKNESGEAESAAEENESDVFDFGDISNVSLDEDDGYRPIEQSDLDKINNTIGDKDESDDEGYVELDMDDFIGIDEPGDEDISEISQDDFTGLEESDDDDSSEISISDLDDFVGIEESYDEDLQESFTGDELNSENRFMDKEETAPAMQKKQNASSGGDLSTQLLMKIAEELASIRGELSSLKKEFSGIKVAAAADGAKDDLYDREDEKIALTGDELDNILSTADFTEEAGDDVNMELSEDLSISTGDIEESDINDISEELSDDLGGIELGTDDFESPAPLDDTDFSALDELDAFDETPDFAEEISEELIEIREQGVEPMTFPPLPEDTDYLAEDLTDSVSLDGDLNLEETPEEISLDTMESLSADNLSEDSLSVDDLSSDFLDLDEAVIGEDESSLDDISLDMDITELDTAELASVDLDSSSLDFEETDLAEPNFGDLESIELEPIELELEMDTGKDGDTSLIPEGFTDDLGLDDNEELSIEDLDSGELDFAELEEGSDFDSTPFDSGDILADDSIPELEDVEPETFDGEELESLDIIADIEELEELDVSPAAPDSASPAPEPEAKPGVIPSHLKQELKTVLAYMDQLLESLPDDKVEEFARSEYYETYKKLFKELGLV